MKEVAKLAFIVEQSTSIIKTYQKTIAVNEKLLAQFTGIKILRRLIGIAQLPLSLDLATKKEMMERAAGWIKAEKLAL